MTVPLVGGGAAGVRGAIKGVTSGSQCKWTRGQYVEAPLG